MTVGVSGGALRAGGDRRFGVRRRAGRRRSSSSASATSGTTSGQLPRPRRADVPGDLGRLRRDPQPRPGRRGWRAASGPSRVRLGPERGAAPRAPAGLPARFRVPYPPRPRGSSSSTRSPSARGSGARPTRICSGRSSASPPRPACNPRSTLLPAARTGPAYVRDNGSPARGRCAHPWVVFGVLGFGACARSYYLGLSAQYSGDPGYYESYSSTIFGPYFLVPIGLAVAVLLLEAGLAGRRAWLVNLALLAPAALVALAMVGHQPYPIYRKFLGLSSPPPSVERPRS